MARACMYEAPIYSHVERHARQPCTGWDHLGMVSARQNNKSRFYNGRSVVRDSADEFLPRDAL